MKKKPLPIALISVLLIVVGVVAILNLPEGSFGSGEPNPADPLRGLEVGPERATPDKSSLADMTKLARKNPKLEAGTDVPDKLPELPTILIPRAPKVKPKPTESSISTQWYTEGSRNAGR